jgi:hypothetical protein
MPGLKASHRAQDLAAKGRLLAAGDALSGKQF